MQDFFTELKEHSIYRNGENTKRIKQCLGELSEEEIWIRPNDASNSMGNLILHLCGNIRQYIISSLGGSEDIRERESEFTAKGGFTKEGLIVKLTNTVAEANKIIKEAPSEELLRKRNVQGYFYSGIGIVMHVVEHYSYHTGQIAFWVKQLKNKDLGFYAGIDLNIKNND